VDHPDGLADPAEYLQRLRDGGASRVWVEKILDPGEQLRDWPVCGTVGYEFLNDVQALFIDASGEAPLTALWEEVSGDPRPFGEWAHEAKLEQASGTFRPEVEWLERELGREPPVELAHALSSLPVYRTYIAHGQASDADRAVAPPLLLEESTPPGFVTRFQQTTPAVMAKGVEDTAFYRYARLLALNDVGGDPSRFGIDVDTFHAANAERAARFPLNLLTTQTHDAKRSGDVRARIGALSEVADEWAAHVRRWFELNESLRSVGPDRVEEYFVYQTLLGAWPIEPERVEEYMEKALREAKRNTNWIEQNEEWEGGVKRFVRALYSHRPFLDDFEPFADRVADIGERSALGQIALKLTSPGVPDIYQGDELPFRALVDPDNRRPVDWDERRAELDTPSPHHKFWLIRTLLDLRGRRPEAFAGAYEPLDGPDGVCAFARGGDVAVAVALRSGTKPTLTPPGPGWGDVLGDRVPGVTVLERGGL
jgi:(1->4)-alpha-D-glucan 1-alpha-D-glucosylmutase